MYTHSMCKTELAGSLCTAQGAQPGSLWGCRHMGSEGGGRLNRKKVYL